jgi:hypothetical protein
MDGVTQQVYYSFVTMSMLLVTHYVMGLVSLPPLVELSEPSLLAQEWAR